MKYILAAILVLATTTLSAKELSLEEVMQATCRITVPRINQFNQVNGHIRGTGTVIKEDDNNYYILTNGHVASKVGSDVKVEFFNDGYKSALMPARVSWRYYKEGSSMDAAILSIAKSSFGAFKPRVIPIAPKTHKLNPGDKIYGAGHPAGRWSMAWFARIIRDEGNKIHFNMAPEGGQSGSGILSTVKIGDELFTRVSGIVTWRIGPISNKIYGGGVSLARLYELLEGTAENDTNTYLFTFPNSVEVGNCANCGKEKDDHYCIKTPNGLFKVNDKLQIFCGKDMTYHRKKILAGDYGVGSRIVKYGTLFPDLRNPRGDVPSEPPNVLPPIEQPDDTDLLELKKKIVELEADNKRLLELHDRLANENNLLQSRLDAKIKELDDLNVQIDKALEELREKTDDNLAIQNKLDQLDARKTELETEKTKLEADKAKVETDYNKVVSENSKLESDRDALLLKLKEILERRESMLNKLYIPYITDNFGGLGTWLLGIVTMILGGTVVITLWSKYGYPMVVGRLGVIPAKMIDVIIKRKFAKKAEETNKSVDKRPDLGYNNNEGNDVWVRPPNVYPQTPTGTQLPPAKVVSTEPINQPVIDKVVEAVQDTKPTTTNVSINESFNTYNLPQDYAKELFEQNGNTLKGYSLKRWAIYCGLYQDALKQLKNNGLFYKEQVVLQGQQEAAKAIENWVIDEFHNKASVTSLGEVDNIYHKALLGFLYYEAVQKLGKGEFYVLGNVESANTIERWVQEQFYNRMNIGE